MTCDVIDIPGGGRAIVCSRGRRAKRKPCATCKELCDLLCDGHGCDKPLCPSCAVSPSRDIDFCPLCCREAFTWWLRNENGKAAYTVGRAVGRNAFRTWAKANADKFIAFVRNASPTVVP